MAQTNPCWIELAAAGRLAIAPRPRAEDWLEDEIAGWKDVGVDVVVSLLEDDEIRDLHLMGEEAACVRKGIGFLRFPIPDRAVPESRLQTRCLADDLSGRIRAGRSVLIHCRAGIGRSSLIAACVMDRLGVAASEALARISRARGLQVPDTDAQRDWLKAFIIDT
jgi:protein-tyrosine phosphatase